MEENFYESLNRALRDAKGEIYDIIVGDFLVVGLTEDDFGSLSDELVKKFTGLFEYPETFYRIGGQIITETCLDEI